MKRTILFHLAALAVSLGAFAQKPSLREGFINPSEENKPLIIWQWMDGLVSKEAITKDLEAFKAAGLAGVQNFQIGGEGQIRVSDPTYNIGTEKWKEMMRWAMDECARLGLSFGTHNCPGWSSSAYGTITPEYSMQKVVWSNTLCSTEGKGKVLSAVLARPEIDPKYNYYEDICVLLMPNDSIIQKANIVNVSEYFNRETGTINIPKSAIGDEMLKQFKDLKIVRYGHTTNGKTNASQSPVSGQGLECDKLRREAVKFFWDSYPQMLLDIAGEHAGKTFTRLEIDSYEAGGQTWSVILPDEFKKRKGYDLLPYLPYIADQTIIDNNAASDKFKKDFIDVLTSLFAENYYGYMSELTERTPGMHLFIEPYGTNGQKPFQVLDTYKILHAAPTALVATEFWVRPNWGWNDMVKHEKAMRSLQKPMLYAEAFTCVPSFAWSDDPHSLKLICDRAFCRGVNRMMLHAGACNPWLNVEPGMSFGVWGTQFVPTQTWWRAGGANVLFAYMARCQSLLQRGVPALEQWHNTKSFLTYHRKDGNTDILFIANPTENAVSETLDLASIAMGRNIQVWDPYSITMKAVSGVNVEMNIEPVGSRFIILSDEPFEPYDSEEKVLVAQADGNPVISLEEGWTLDNSAIPALFDWSTSDDKDMKYFSGTKTYRNSFKLKKSQIHEGMVLDLGNVSNMANVRVNGKEFPLVWKAPFMLDISSAVQKGVNTIEIDVTNLWPNRLIGDEQEPDDMQWSDNKRGSSNGGVFLTAIPDWLKNGTPRPSKGRKTVVAYKHFGKDSKLLPSGLLGPVTIK